MNAKFSCIVVDDEPLALELIVGYVKRTPFLNLVGQYNSGIDALSNIVSQKVDVVFLDIQMPDLTGIELSKVIMGQKTKVIFTTAYENYALDGYKVDALDYLVKPISYSEFLRAANKAYRWFLDGSFVDSKPVAESFFVKSNYKLIQIQVSQIKYIESVKDYLKICTDAEEGEVLTLMSMATIEKHLPSDTFIRVHRSFIVNINKIKTIERNRVVFGNVYIPISETYREQFNRIFDQRTLQ
ncbi:LytTR family DNA-binding domain-containing protein [uncultured Acetobacteroides sp.]|uniref:LytR/AlgR family response regulator transcription factor n=1 Tax=uncultured Acetobacteroides sp. TaxID=1760811 RepID=UPI0029F4F85A|nr:LytTR family DNA-binding domain-containing protein [uncultured Acetobacteroides sp.]